MRGGMLQCTPVAHHRSRHHGAASAELVGGNLQGASFAPDGVPDQPAVGAEPLAGMPQCHSVLLDCCKNHRVVIAEVHVGTEQSGAVLLHGSKNQGAVRLEIAAGPPQSLAVLFHCRYYSLGALIVYYLFDFNSTNFIDLKRESLDDKVFESILNTKLYWFLKRCLNDNPKKRILLYL